LNLRRCSACERCRTAIWDVSVASGQQRTVRSGRENFPFLLPRTLECGFERRAGAFQIGETTLHLGSDSSLLLEWRYRQWQARKSGTAQMLDSDSPCRGSEDPGDAEVPENDQRIVGCNRVRTETYDSVLIAAGWEFVAPHSSTTDLCGAAGCFRKHDIAVLEAEDCLLLRRKIHMQHVREVELAVLDVCRSQVRTRRNACMLVRRALPAQADGSHIRHLRERPSDRKSRLFGVKVRHLLVVTRLRSELALPHDS
jgi:hypothetical protein